MLNAGVCKVGCKVKQGREGRVVGDGGVCRGPGLVSEAARRSLGKAWNTESGGSRVGTGSLSEWGQGPESSEEGDGRESHLRKAQSGGLVGP